MYIKKSVFYLKILAIKATDLLTMLRKRLIQVDVFEPSSPKNVVNHKMNLQFNNRWHILVPA